MALRQMKFLFLLLFCVFHIIACQSPEDLGKLDGAITPDKIRAHLQILSDDIMEGRAPGTRGGELAAKYIASQFQEAGLQPAVGDSSYFQEVELIGIKSTPFLQVRGYNLFWQLTPGTEFVGWTQIEEENVSIRNKEVLFLGYGIDAPEFNWNDYNDVDVTGKILLMLVNEPPSQTRAFFDSTALTYYGRWTYKFEEAARKGADGVILIHTPELAGYDWNVVQNSRTRESFFVRQSESKHMLSLRAWITQQKTSEILRAGGLDLQQLIANASSSSFEPMPLDLRISAVIQTQIRIVKSPNVIAKIPGSDPALKDQCVILTSHYDHLGKNDLPEPEDSIYNGAVDNASGTAVLIAIAEALSRSRVKPKRTLLFAAVTAEESGLLGSQFYVENPLFPMSKTVANINIDAVNVLGRTEDIMALGAERSSLIEVIEKVAHEMNMEISPEPNPEQGAFFRSDQFSFVEKGVPAVFLESGTKYTGRSSDFGTQQAQDYLVNRYHKATDEYDPEWSLEGAAQLAQFALKTCLAVANGGKIPVWREKESFKRVREESMWQTSP